MSDTPKKQTKAIAETPKRVTRATSRLEQLTLTTPKGDVKDEPPVEKPAEEGAGSDTDSTGSEPGAAGLDKQQGGINPPAGALAAEKMCSKCEELQRTAALLEETNGRQQQELEQLQEQLARQRELLERKEERIQRQAARWKAWADKEEERAARANLASIRAALPAGAQAAVDALELEATRHCQVEVAAQDLIDKMQASSQVIADALSDAPQYDVVAAAVKDQRRRITVFKRAVYGLSVTSESTRARINSLLGNIKALLRDL
ncbi:hypothetical protein JCM8208_000424 [Rhodotorula glutinis]